jgi:hypothetical protein
LNSEVQKAFSQTRDKKATGDDGDVPAEVLQLLGEEGHKPMSQLIYTVSDRRMISWN